MLHCGPTGKMGWLKALASPSAAPVGLLSSWSDWGFSGFCRWDGVFFENILISKVACDETMRQWVLKKQKKSWKTNLPLQHPAVVSPQVRPHGTTTYCSDLLTDGGCVALLVVGFLLVTPLLVLALAAYCRLARHLQLGLCFIPYSRAVYKNLPATHHRGLGTGCCGSRDGTDGGGKGKVWVWDDACHKGDHKLGSMKGN